MYNKYRIFRNGRTTPEAPHRAIRYPIQREPLFEPGQMSIVLPTRTVPRMRGWTKQDIYGRGQDQGDPRDARTSTHTVGG